MLRLKNEIYMEGELVAFDHIKLQPGEQDMTGLGFMEGYTHLGSFIVIGEKTDEKLLDQLYEAIQKETGDISFGLSQLTVPGFIVRIMATYTQIIERTINVGQHISTGE